MESINPNDIITLDMEQISYITLKNGDMILIDESVPQKSKNEKKLIQKTSSIGSNEPVIRKEIKLEISSPLIISFKGNKNNNNNNKNKSNFKIGNKIIKNTNFSFKGIKTNNNSSNAIGSFNNTKENKDKYKINLDELLKENDKNNKYNINNKDIPLNQNIPNYNNYVNTTNSSKENLDYNQFKLNTNLSIPFMNFNNNDNNINQENQNNIGSRRKSRASRIFGVGGGGKTKSKIKINAVCSLNIHAEEKNNINLIRQFNNLVDKLNEERDKKPIYEKDNLRDNKTTRFYEFYKDKRNNTMKKNIETLNQNFNGDINSEYSRGLNEEFNFKDLNNLNKRNCITFNGIENNNGFRDLQNFGKKSNILASTGLKKFQNKINKHSSWLVLPSNNYIHL